MSAVLEQSTTTSGLTASGHPLNPLDENEIRAVVERLRAHFEHDMELLFETIELLEPDKGTVRRFVPGTAIERAARFNVYKRGQTGLWSGTINISRAEILSIGFLPDARPMIAPDEFMMIENVAKASAEFQAALARRGIDDLSLVCVDPWSAGNFNVPGEEDKRLSHAFVWVRMFELDNYYAHPVEGLNVVVDIDLMEIVRVDDHGAATGNVVPVPQTLVNYDSAVLTEFRIPLKPLDVVQSEGPSFVVEGNKLSWDNWDVRIGFNGREGLVLHQLGYTHKGSAGPWRIACPCQRWLCPTVRLKACIIARTCLTVANMALASW